MDESRKNNISPWTQHAGEDEEGGGVLQIVYGILIRWINRTAFHLH